MRDRRMRKLLFFLLGFILVLVGQPRGAASARMLPAGSMTAQVQQDYHPRPPHPYQPPPTPPVPQVTKLQTVPPIAGVTFQIAGQQFVTGTDGSTIVVVPGDGTYDLQVITDTYQDPYQRVEFSRWLSQSFVPTRQIHLPSTDPEVQVGLNTFELVGEKFVSPDSLPVNPQRITSFTIRSSQGDSFTFADGQPRWIPASRVTRRRDGSLDVVKLLYTVTQVTVDGSNVVNKSQQQFYAEPNGTWTISLLFYSLRIQAADALFGFPVGQTIALYLPNGQVQTYPLDASGAVQIRSLARGDYNFRISGVRGLSTLAPVALSKDQTVATRVITYLDLGVVAAFGLFIAILLLVIGRLMLRHSHAQNEDTRPTRAYGGT